ncbi:MULTISPECIES: sterol desaturase family protein [Rhizobium]|uniref:Sterol desaturase family protein n=1 Tax=Rhizobium tropici TaxID=398 RepID=A0A329YJF9_RHITR|nr:MULTISPECIES: sterol desaturase family protein [Rhizobium]MBB3291066.1 sterol desaturase/sphingolipid hydroxylase (fatty acid hydroxylase superfamily) [Rhizobium sp. BK252]MBB3405845.1 sterol desaturase/sphingolipid hydroxylase (fatty acid hydroxylase superfamily) [Rhizobium sp. BK289]MBB3418393.1 sterol desaturase/sphingolipid hydroxylase (fatty acid hydroxylase superfamily) [Rhizobium sp. BK284]MBB3486271.1 sterol desaturase/sphingolipid hydroxylase (fatty acid hydroxylase superfamily) [Rh
MDDLSFGKRNKRGDWAPDGRIETAPVFTLPPKPVAFLKWLPHYFLPWNVLFAASAVAYWHFIVPEAEVLKTFHIAWILRLFLVNCVAVFLFYGAFELRLYILRTQENRFKYNGKFPGDSKNPAFLFDSQNADGIIRTFGTALPIWTALEVGILYAFANGLVPWVSFAAKPWYLFGIALVMPIFHEAHFFAIHRLIHWGPLYRWIHSVHHNSVNPSPWSSLSMHPVEQLLYFSSALIHLVIPSNPILAIYQLHYSGFGAVVGHLGFDKIELGAEAAIDSHAYTHYLHHKFFEVNYGDGLVPFDKWFGTWHDGTKESDARMQARYEKRKARANAASAAK